jgi:dihydrodipicolinate synthase/N-acetylneuraminate lyase
MDSFIITSGNIFPEFIHDLISAGNNGDILKIRKLQERLSNAITVITKQGKYCLSIRSSIACSKSIILGTWVQTMKEAMNLLTDINVGPPRVPLKPLSLEATVAIKKDLMNLGFCRTIELN